MEIGANKRKYMEALFDAIVSWTIIVISVFCRFNGPQCFVIFGIIERDVCKLIPLATIVQRIYIGSGTMGLFVRDLENFFLCLGFVFSRGKNKKKHTPT